LAIYIPQRVCVVETRSSRLRVRFESLESDRHWLCERVGQPVAAPEPIIHCPPASTAPLLAESPNSRHAEVCVGKGARAVASSEDGSRGRSAPSPGKDGTVAFEAGEAKATFKSHCICTNGWWTPDIAGGMICRDFCPRQLVADLPVTVYLNQT